MFQDLAAFFRYFIEIFGKKLENYILSSLGLNKSYKMYILVILQLDGARKKAENNEYSNANINYE